MPKGPAGGSGSGAALLTKCGLGRVPAVLKKSECLNETPRFSLNAWSCTQVLL